MTRKESNVVSYALLMISSSKLLSLSIFIDMLERIRRIWVVNIDGKLLNYATTTTRKRSITFLCGGRFSKEKEKICNGK